MAKVGERLNDEPGHIEDLNNTYSYTLSGDDGGLSNWKLDGLLKQYSFLNETNRPPLIGEPVLILQEVSSLSQ